jgi:hypothetical protein
MNRKDQKLIWEAYTSGNSFNPHQERQYSILRDFGWEYEDSVKGNIIVKRMDRGMDSSITLGYGVILKDGTFERLKRGQDPYDFIDEMLMGTPTEKKEHGGNTKQAEKVAADHLTKEDPHYYTKLKKAGL